MKVQNPQSSVRGTKEVHHEGGKSCGTLSPVSPSQFTKKNTVNGYEFVLNKFSSAFTDRDLRDITSEDLLFFLTQLSDGLKKATKRMRFATLSAFFNFIQSIYDPDLINPCESPMLRKQFRAPNEVRWDFLEKETVDEIIFKIPKTRDRLLVELMARGGLRVGEVLKLRPRDIGDRKLLLQGPKSGREQEVAFIPLKVVERLKEFIRQNEMKPEQRIFQIRYAAARAVVKKAGERIGIHLRPHDLRRHAATFASRSGTPIEIISKVILRHANLATTQRHLGKVSDTEALRWIEALYG